MKLSRSSLVCALAALVLAAPVAVQAQSPAPGIVRIQDAPQGVPLPVLISQLERKTGGQFVSANPTRVEGRDAYWIRLRFDGGRFEDYFVDAQTGRILSGP
jgi:hypothetical protein